MTMTRSPARRPSVTATSLPTAAPSVTGRARATSWPDVEAVGVVGFGRADDGRQRHRDAAKPRGRSCRWVDLDGANHARPEPAIAIREGHFDGEDTALGISRRRDARHAASEGSTWAGLGRHRHRLTQRDVRHHTVGHAEHRLDVVDTAQHEGHRARAGQHAGLNTPLEHDAVDRRRQHTIDEREPRGLDLCLGGSHPGRGRVCGRLRRIAIGLGQALGGE
jgi:hypothetical protein